MRELERGATNSTGTVARIGLWQEHTSKLRFWEDNDTTLDIEPGRNFAGRAFELQRPIFSGNPIRDNPDGAASYRSRNIGAVLATPITAGERRLGVLAFSAERAPIFAVSDIELAGLLADQAAVVLESRALIDHATRVRAREEATRLKEDFLSAAAHDLKTPLTTVVAQAEFLERRAVREPSAPADLAGIRRVVRESKRLAGLVGDLLDATRLEQGGWWANASRSISPRWRKRSARTTRPTGAFVLSKRALRWSARTIADELSSCFRIWSRTRRSTVLTARPSR